MASGARAEQRFWPALAYGLAVGVCVYIVLELEFDWYLQVLVVAAWGFLLAYVGKWLEGRGSH
jgi:hypothetical protein